MTNAELKAELSRQQAENEALRVQVAAFSASPPLPEMPAYALAGLLSYLLAEAHTGVVLIDADYRVQWVNAGFTALTGFAAAAVVGQQPAAFLRGPGLGAVLGAYVEENLRLQCAIGYELPQLDQAAVRWLRVRVQPVPARSGSPVRYVGLLEDITAWKQEQLARANGDQRFRTLAENVPGVLYEWRKHDQGPYHFDYVSPKVSELFGLEPEDLSRMTDFIPADELEGFLQNLDYATRHHLPWAYEGRVVVPGQPVRWLRGNSIVTETGPGWVKYSGILLDITPLKMAEAAVRESNMRGQLVLEGFGDGTWETNLRTHATYYSPEYKAMLGYSDEAFAELDGDVRQLVHADDYEQVMRLITAFTAETIPAYVCQVRLRCADGRYKWVLARAVITARDAAGRPTILTGSNTDISALKEAQNALDATNRRLSTVIDNFREGIVLEDEHRRIMLTNEAFCQQLPEPTLPAQLIGMNGAQLAEQNGDYMRKPAAFLARLAVVLARRELVLGDKLELLDRRVLQRG